jgi:nucleoside-diphosphate-sugar epimerase
MNKILVTGGGGFLGTVLVDALLGMGYSVRVLDNLYRKSDYLITLCGNPSFEFVYGDILDAKVVKKAMDGVDAVVHLAALVGEPVCKKHPDLAKLVNVMGTDVVCQEKPKDVPLVFASTGSVYGRVDGVCTEQSPLNALSLYALTKIDAEKIVLGFDNSVVYRFSTAFGISGNIRVNLLVNDLAYTAVANKSLVMFQPDFRRSFVHCCDIASAIIHGLVNYESMKGQVYNVGHPDGNWTKRQLAEYIKERTGCFVCYAESGYVDPDQRDYEIDFSKIEKTGWKAVTSIETGVDELLKAASIINITHQYM